MVIKYRDVIRMTLFGRHDKNINDTTSIYQGYDRYALTTTGGGVNSISLNNTNNNSSEELTNNFQKGIDSSPCSKFNDCYNCSSFLKDSVLCKWSDNICLKQTEEHSNNRWYVKYSECVDDNKSLIIKEKYCGENNSIISTVSNQIQLNKLDGIYGVPNMYCKWDTPDIDVQKTVNFNFTLLSFNPNTDRYTFVIQFGYGSFLYSDLIDSKSFHTNTISSITMHYFSSAEKQTLPFVFEISYSPEEDQKGTSIMVYLVLSIATMFSCLFLIVCIFTCLRGIIKELYNNNNNPNQNNINQENKTNLKLDILTQFELTPTLYNENLNEFGCICTICLENFSENTEVVKLECKHLYHKSCFCEYFKKNPNRSQCPNCNNSITPGKCEKFEEQTNFIANNYNNNNILSSNQINIAVNQ